MKTKIKDMKKIILQTAAILLILAGMIACGKNDDTVKTVKVTDFEYVICQNTIQSSTDIEQANDNEYIKCYAIDETTLKFEQQIYLNCCVDSLRITPNINDRNIITINEVDYGNECNCICLSYICFDISDLVKNTTYTFVIKRNNQDYYSFEVLFNENSNLIFNL
jgi:GTP-dependent phosphoenolpyruvate carboxykinase